MHASWLNQIEIHFPVVQRKVVSPNDVRDPAGLDRLLRRLDLAGPLAQAA